MKRLGIKNLFVASSWKRRSVSYLGDRIYLIGLFVATVGAEVNRL